MTEMSEIRSLATHARNERNRLVRQGNLRSVLVTAGVVVIWVAAISITGQWERISNNTAAAITMIFGSFVAGSTPQGGGAVAFPVFTKLLDVSAADARTFSLSIQALGMGTAAIAIALTRRPIDRGALRLTVPAAVAGYLAASWALVYATPPSAYTKVFFTLVVLATGAATVLSRRGAIVEQLTSVSLDRRATRAALVAVASAGGAISALLGSGADVAVYLLVTVVLGVRPSIGVATSVVTMASVSIVGLALSLATGALSPTSILSTTDLFGMWLAAIPVVVIGAPMGSWLASRVSSSVLTYFIAALSALEVISTAAFLEDLRTNRGVLLFSVIGLVAVVYVVKSLLAVRSQIAATRDPQCHSIRRLDLELGMAAQ